MCDPILSFKENFAINAAERVIESDVLAPADVWPHSSKYDLAMNLWTVFQSESHGVYHIYTLFMTSSARESTYLLSSKLAYNTH